MAFTPIEDSDRDEVVEFVERHWLGPEIVSSGRKYHARDLDGLIERREGRIAGLVTFRCDEQGLEVLTLNATRSGAGVGTSLMLAAIDIARRRDIRRVWMTTTNDNMRAVGLFQRLGFRLTEVRVGAVDAARKLKPQIPKMGHSGIPIHDELVLELKLKPSL